MSTAEGPPDARTASGRASGRHPALLLSLPVMGFAVGLAVHRVLLAVLGPVVVAALLVLVVVALVRRRREQARARRDEEQVGRSPARATTTASARRWRLRPLLFFYYGYFPAYVLGGLSIATAALVLLSLLAAALLLMVAVRASRRRRWARARAAHPGAAVVVGALVGLASMRLMQWFGAAQVLRPFVPNGRAVVAADADGVTLEGDGRHDGPVHRWAWPDVEVSSRASPDGALLVLTLLGPLPAVRGRVVPAVRRRFEVTVALHAATLAATVLPTPLAAVDDAVAALLARRPASVGAPGPDGATGGAVGPAGGTAEAPLG